MLHVAPWLKGPATLWEKASIPFQSHNNSVAARKQARYVPDLYDMCGRLATQA